MNRELETEFEKYLIPVIKKRLMVELKTSALNSNNIPERIRAIAHEIEREVGDDFYTRSQAMMYTSPKDKFISEQTKQRLKLLLGPYGSVMAKVFKAKDAAP